MVHKSAARLAPVLCPGPWMRRIDNFVRKTLSTLDEFIYYETIHSAAVDVYVQLYA